MRFKGTLVMLVVCLLLGGYIYFYEIKGGEKREKAKEAESQVWKFDASGVQQIDLTSSNGRITAVRHGTRDWVLTAPRSLEGDADELTNLAQSASNIQRENTVEPNAADLAKFGLSPAKIGVKVKTRDRKEYGIDFGNNNPTGNSAYAVISGQKEVFLVTNSVVTAFDKKLDDLRNHKILSFDQPEARSLTIKSAKGDLNLEKDSEDRWWLIGKEKIAADSPGVRGMLNAISLGKVKEFFNDAPEEYRNLVFDHPLLDIRLTHGKNKAVEHLIIGLEKSKLRKKSEPEAAKNGAESAMPELYLAKNESRPDLFFVEKELVDKLLKSPGDLRDKALAAIQRWNIDFISITNAKGTFGFTKTGGEWFLAGSKKKAKWDGVNGILDVMEKPAREWIDQPASLSAYGLDRPLIRVVLKQGATTVADCAFGKSAKEGIYAQVKGDPSVKVADPDGLGILDKPESEFVEPAPAQGMKK